MTDSLQENFGPFPILIDGAMGATISALGLTADDFDGVPGCNEILNRTRPDAIADIHRSFFNAGSKMVETNTFGGNPIKLDEWGQRESTLELNRLAAEIARDVAKEFNGHVIGSMGPSGLIPSLPDYKGPTPAQITEAFATQAEGLILGGVDFLLVETVQDILEFKSAIIGCRDAIEKTGRSVPIWGSVSLHMNGRMLMGTSIDAALNIGMAMGVDVFGINCATGPTEMSDSVRYLTEHSPLPIIVFPNQGMPESIDGRLAYSLSPDEFAEALSPFLKMGVEIIGGCCGTSPDLIGALNKVLGNYKPRSIPSKIFALTSAVSSQDINPEGSPLIIGERLNSYGSRKFRKLLLDEKWPEIVDIASKQNEIGAMVLDLAFAVDGRDDEPGDYKNLVHRIASEIPLPLMIDSINPDAVEAALKANPGIGIVNSINLENPDKARRVLGYLKRYGGAVVAMTIDENGMAKTVDRKVEVAQNLYKLIVDEFDFDPESILFDPLTFTLATGEDEFRDTARLTLEGIKAIRDKFPQCGVVLGISNVSYGLKPGTRKLLNAVFMHHAAQNGLTAAIVNPLDVDGYHDFDRNQIDFAEDLIFNRRDDALERLIELSDATDMLKRDSETESKIDLPSQELLAKAILDRKESAVESLIDRCLENSTAAEIVNEILLPAMKEVGDRMERRETILPHVLRSAEVMKKALDYLEPMLGSGESKADRTVILATVFGDVHDIGKNLVKAIVSNNGFNVIDLGKQVPVREIVETAEREKPMAIGLSALLVATAAEMGSYVQALKEHNLDVPVIVGGAAVSPGLAKKISYVNGEKYDAGVWYAKDAFEALDICRSIAGDDLEATKIPSTESKPSVTISKPARTVTTSGMRKWETISIQKPQVPPFTGSKTFEFTVDDLLSAVTPEETKKLQLDPALTINAVKDATQSEIVIDPKGIYAFFNVKKDGQNITLAHKNREFTFTFPDKKKSVPNWLDDEDYLMPYVATIGSVAVDIYQKLESEGQLVLSNQWSELCALLAEVTARLVRSKIAVELNLHPQTPVLGVSPGYALWPDLSDQQKLQEILNWTSIGLSLTERHQIVPEFSTSGIAIIHPAAGY